MLADQRQNGASAGTLDRGVHKPREFLSSLVQFIAEALPNWRDDPARDKVAGETRLTAQLCAKLNSLARHSPGWDILQFRREEPDEADGRRAIDLVASPSGEVVVVEGREYNEYQSLLPIECKRLPTPTGKDRDEREYVISQYSSTGGVSRFKEGHHGKEHNRAAMIAYIQDDDVPHWCGIVDSWIDELANDPSEEWTNDDKLSLLKHDQKGRLGFLQSLHLRKTAPDPIHIDHIWIVM